MAVQTLHLINNDIGPQTIKSRATDVFHLQAFVFPKVGNAGGGTVALAINCTDSRGVNGPTTVTAKSQAMPATGAWSMLDGFATVPTGYDTVDPVLTLTSVPTSDSVYVDDALVRESTYAQQIMSTIFSTTALPAAGAAAIPSANVASAGLGGTDIGNDLASLATNLWGSITTGNFSGALQNIADAMHQITFGGGAVGTALDIPSLKAMMGAQPAATVVPTPNPLTAGGITRGANSAGASNTSTGAHFVTASYTHTPAATDNFVMVPVMYCGTGTGSGPSGTVIYGSQGSGLNVTLGSLTGKIQIGSTNMYAEVFGGFITPGSGAQTVLMSAGQGSPSGGGYLIAGYSDSFTGVLSVGAIGSYGNTTGTPAASGVTSATTDYEVMTFVSGYTSSVNLASLTGATSRYASAAVFSSAASEYMSMISGDQVGAASMNFGASTSNAFATWVGLRVQLIGATTTPIGSGFRSAYLSTTAQTALTGTNILANSMFTQQTATPDMVYAPASNNMLTVKNAGWYMVSIQLAQNGAFGGSYELGPVLYHNGAVYRAGGRAAQTSHADAMASTFLVYCNVNDTLQPGYFSGYTASLACFVGDAGGTLTYFDVALLNRSLL